MMEPVAYAAFEPNGYIRIWSTDPGKVESYDITPLVRLSDAEARIAELEAEKERLKAEREEADHKLVDRYRDPKTGTFSFPGDVAAIVRRLDAAEALLKEAGKVIRDYRKGVPTGHQPHMIAARADAVIAKIGVKDA